MRVNFVFESHVIGKATLKIPLSSGVNLTYTNINVVNGTNEIYWDGIYNGVNYLENLTADIITSNIEISVEGAEVYFPFLDVEYNQYGVIIKLLDEDYNNYSPKKDRVYWDVSGLDAKDLKTSSTYFSNISTGIF